VEPFFQSNRLWPPGHRQLQLLIIPDLELNPEFATFVTKCRKVMVNHAATTLPMPDEALHMTVQPIYYPPGRGHADAVVREQLVDALEYELSKVSPFVLLIGSPLVYHGGVVADAHYDVPFDALVYRVRSVIIRVCGAEAITHSSRPAHMAFCYATGHSSSDDLQRDLRHQVRPSHAYLSVRDVHLVETRQVPEQGCYLSDIVHTFKLRPN
jgi:hypothetical protein